MAEQYIYFTRRIPDTKKLKTEIVCVCAVRGDYILGHIKWHGEWRQYSFFPEASTIYSVGCLETINERIKSMMEARK